MDMDTSPEIFYLGCHGGDPVGTDKTFETTIGFYVDFGVPLDTSTGLRAVQGDVEPVYKFGRGTSNPVPDMDLAPNSNAEEETQKLAFGSRKVAFLEKRTTLHAYIGQFEAEHGTGHELRVMACASRAELQGNSPRTRDKEAPQGWRIEDANKGSRRFIENAKKTQDEENQRLITLAGKDWNAAVKAILGMSNIERAFAANRTLLRFPVLYAMAWDRRPSSASARRCDSFLQKLMWRGAEDAGDFSASLDTAYAFSQMFDYFAEDCRCISAAVKQASQNDWDRIKEDPAWKLFMTAVSTQQWGQFKLPSETWTKRLTTKTPWPPDEERRSNARLNPPQPRDDDPESAQRRREAERLAGEETAKRYRQNQPPGSTAHRNYSRDPYPVPKDRNKRNY